MIDFRIEKPRVELPAGSLVATTDSLLRASGIPHELLERTGVRTPLGEVLIARLKGPGAIEVAGPERRRRRAPGERRDARPRRRAGADRRRDRPPRRLLARRSRTAC